MAVNSSGLTANAITVAEVIELFNDRFAAVAAAAERRGFALWVGSGISLARAPSLGDMLTRAIEHLRLRVDPNAGNCKFKLALGEIIEKSELDTGRRAAIQFNRPFAEWPEKRDIIAGLWNRYSEVLDIRVADEPDDYMLWEAVDVRNTYGMLDNPDCEHLCIAILVMEGAIADIASANWDGLIEAAIRRLSGGTRLVQVVVDPAHLRDQPARTRLIKFHGCAVYCNLDPATYRHCLIGTRSQITDWPYSHASAAIRRELTTVATNSRTLMVGLSLQDTNLQALFAEAKNVLPWSWPCSPGAQGHVFCEDRLGENHLNMLRVVYKDDYGTHRQEIERSALFRAYAKPALLGLVLHLLSEKFTSLVASACAPGPLGVAAGELSEGIKHLLRRVAAAADDDRLLFINTLIRLWARGMALFRRGDHPPLISETYEAISPLSIQEMEDDPNVSSSGLPELAVSLALLGRGDSAAKWYLSLTQGTSIEQGPLQATGTWNASKPAHVYFVSSAAAALELIRIGATDTENVVVIHSDDAWDRMMDTATAAHRSPRGAPGRTGRTPARHVSIRRLLRHSPDRATLEQQFAEEVVL